MWCILDLSVVFIEFCNRAGVPIFPASERTLILFVTEIAQVREHSTVRVYLSGVRHFHIINGWANPLDNTPRLDLVLREIKLEKPQQADPRLPITPSVLASI